MGFVKDLPKHKLGVRWLMAAILVPGFLFQRMTPAIFVASVVYFLAEEYRIRSVSQRLGVPVSEMVRSSGLFLRRGFLWLLIGLSIFYNVMIVAELFLGVGSGAILYVGGLFAQSVQKHSRVDGDSQPPRAKPAVE